MELTDELRDRIEQLLSDIDGLDPAQIPDPAAELARLLGELLEGTDTAD